MQKLYTLFLTSLFCALFKPVSTHAQMPGCPNMYEWKFVIPVKVVNNNNVDYTDFQVVINLNTRTLIQRGLMHPTGDDIRIKDTLCRSLHYWTDGINTTNSTIWTKLKFLPKNSSTTIYLYYGNLCSASPVKNGDSTFVEFDDFNYFDSTRWKKYAGGSYSVSGGAITVTSTTDIEMVHIKYRPRPLVSTFKISSTSGNYPYAGHFNKNTLTGTGMLPLGGGTNIAYLTISGGPPGGGYGGSAGGTGLPGATSGWTSINWADSGNTKIVWNNFNFTGTASPTQPTDSLQPQFGIFCCGGGGSMTVDWYGESQAAPIQPTATLGTTLRHFDFVQFNKLSFCPGMDDTLRITFNKPSYLLFNPSNTFTMQLSDASGSFASPVNFYSYNDSGTNNWYYPILKNMTPGTRYRVRMVPTNPTYGCMLSIDSFTVHPLPVPDFNIVNNNQCFNGNNYNLTSTSTIASGSIAKHYWDFGDATNDSATTAGIAHHYNTYLGKYKVLLTEKSNFGCIDTVSKYVTIKESPVADFSMPVDIQCLRGNKFQFYSQSSSIVENLNYKWRFGDGDSATTSDSATHTYNTAGNFQITMIVNTATGNCADTAVLYNLVNVHPVASFTVNDTDQCFKDNAFRYINTSTVSSGVGLKSYWDMGNSAIDSLKDTINQVYGAVNNYNVRLIMLSEDGCYDTVIQKVYVFPMPVASFVTNSNTQCFDGNSFGYRAKSTVTPAETIFNDWVYGDGNTANNLDTTTHSYLSHGAYKVVLRSTTSNGCLDTTFKMITVNASPVAGININNDVQCAKGNQFRVKSVSSIASGSFTHKWDLGDGTPVITTDSLIHAYSSAGIYPIKLFLNSDKNCTDTAFDTATVNIMPVPSPSVVGNIDGQCLWGNKFDFTHNSTIPSGSITSIRWEYGDGASVNNVNNVSHSYSLEGPYDVLLIVTSDLNCRDTGILKINVYEQPDANFSINDTDQCLKTNNFIFTDLTYAGAGHVNNWDFGDGAQINGSGAPSVSRKYTTDNKVYTVRLIAVSNEGCSDTVYKYTRVFPQPKPSFTIDKTGQCLLDNNFTFTSTSSIASGNYTHAWNFDDGNTFGNVNTISHAYSNFNPINKPTYRVLLTLTSNFGCTDTFIRPVRVYAMPVADFASDKTESCFDKNRFQFITTSTLYNNGGMTHDWDMGDGNTLINQPNFFHSYATYDTFAITMISTSIQGCKDTVTKSVMVHPMPVAGFTIDNAAQCLKGNFFNFTNTSAIPTGSIVQHSWNFGDTTTDNNTNTGHAYLTPRTANVRLIVTSDHNCLDTSDASIVVYPMPKAAFTLDKDSSCFDKNQFKVTNKSVIIGGTITDHEWDWGDGNKDNSQSPNPYSYAASGNYTIVLTEKTQYGCFDTAHRSLEVFPDPQIDFDVAPVCLKDSSEFINNTTVSSGTIKSYKWIFGDGKSANNITNPKHKYRLVGNYDVSLIAVTNHGCRDTLFLPGKAVVNPLPKAKFTYVKLRSWEKETDVQFIDSSSSDVTSWLWNFGNGSTSTEKNPLEYYTDTANSYITLIVENSYQCRDTTSERILIAPDVIYFMPTAFSPNADNLNETYKPIGLAYAQDYKFIIFNRWGEVLFKTSNPQDAWDGKSNGEIVQQGTYYYRLEFVGVDTLRREEKGSILILR